MGTQRKIALFAAADRQLRHVDDHHFSHTQLHKLLGDGRQILSGRLHICQLAGFKFVDDQVIRIGKARPYQRIPVRIFADKVNGGGNATSLGLLQDLNALSLIHSLQKQEVAQMKDLRVNFAKRYMLRTELAAGTCIGEEGTLTALHAHHIRKAGAFRQNCQAIGVHTALFQHLGDKLTIIVGTHRTHRIDRQFRRELF